MSEPVIVANDLRREFGSFVAVRDVTFDVERGEIFGYLGANGAGKSTTIRMLTGLLTPTGGRATVAGYDVGREPDRVKGAIGYMSQKFSLYLDLLAEHNLEFFGGIYGLTGKKLRHRIDASIERVGLREHRDTLTASLPGGIRQRLALACSLIHEPAIVFLDEPTAGVDPVARRQFWSLIRELSAAGTTVFVTTHYMDEAEYCARIGLMVDGELRALDTPAGLKRDFVPGSTLAVEGHGVHAALIEIRKIDGVLAAEPFGARAHVRFAPGRADEAALAERFTAAGARVTRVEPVDATLEDVFLAVVGDSQRAREAA
ncbi:MAG: ABC transporter ATP-binding protein [Sandaracinaceae bacterium]|nr:ABC transporter ATP-binding protein [Sandaracinaceae bacterium]